MAKSKVKTWSTPVINEKKHPVPCNLCRGYSFKAALFCEGFSYVRCTSCGLVQINPQPAEEEIKKRYNSFLISGCSEESYLSYELKNEEAFLQLQLLALKDAGFNELEMELLKNPNGNKPRILDIGCATGRLLYHLKDRGWNTIGVEISSAEAEYAKNKNLDVRNLPLEENNFPEGSFNVILASHLLEHLNDPASLIREAFRILGGGGSFFITTPNIKSFQAQLFGSRWRSAIFDHLYLFSKKTLRKMLEQNGFSIEKIATWGGLAAGTASKPVKNFFDKAVKRLGLGDVMIIRAKKK